jgi:hypothetical protein
MTMEPWLRNQGFEYVFACMLTGNKKTIMKKIFKILKKLLIQDQNFTFLLGVLVVYLFIIIPFMQENVFNKMIFLLFYYLLLMSTMTLLISRSKKVIVYALFVFPFFLTFIEIYFQTKWMQLLSDFFVIFYCITIGYVILLRTFEMGKMNQRRIQGAIIVYLLAALIFDLIFHILNMASPVKSFSGLQDAHRKQFLYFSLCTLSTNSYGDIIPLTTIVKSLGNMEALIGILYPAILISRLVSMQSYYSDKGRIRTVDESAGIAGSSKASE